MNNTEIKDVILFDGVCNLCNSFVLFVIDRDPQAHFRFAPLQSEFGQKALKERALDATSFNTIVLVQGEKTLLKSTAALTIARKLAWPWPLLSLFFIVPTFLRNIIYDIVAKNRYRWFGKQNECLLPTPALKARFLD